VDCCQDETCGLLEFQCSEGGDFDNEYILELAKKDVWIKGQQVSSNAVGSH
jgi:hypothetical protein